MDENMNSAGGQNMSGGNQNPSGGTGGGNDKGMAIIAYIIFFIPLIVGHRSPFVTYHTNQGTILFLAAIIGNIVLGIIPVLGWILLPFYNLAIVVLMVMGIINAAGDKMKPLPLIGHLQIIK